MRVSGGFGCAVLAALLVVSPQPASAQPPTTLQLQRALHGEFSADNPIRIVNLRGREGGADHYRIERAVTGTQGQGGCRTRFLAPSVINSTVANAADHYVLPWGDVLEVSVQGTRVTWRAKHMTGDERAWFELADAAQARRVGDGFRALAAACGAQMAAAQPAQTSPPAGQPAARPTPSGQPAPAATHVTICNGQVRAEPARRVAACSALLASGEIELTRENLAAAYIFRAVAHSQAGNEAASEADASRALEHNPQMAGAYRIRGISRRNLRRHADALSDLDRSLQIDPTHPTALEQRTSVLIDLKRYSEALQAAELYLRHHPNDASAANLVCWTDAAFLGRDLDRARRHCDTAIRLKADAPAYWDSRGMVGLKQRRFEDAWRDYDQAVKLNAGYAHGRYGRGIAALRLGRTAQGNADLEAARRIDPEVGREYAEYGIRP